MHGSSGGVDPEGLVKEGPRKDQSFAEFGTLDLALGDQVAEFPRRNTEIGCSLKDRHDVRRIDANALGFFRVEAVDRLFGLLSCAHGPHVATSDSYCAITGLEY